MKKLLSMLLASVMVLSLLAGCGGGGNDQPPAQDNTQPSDSQTPSTPEPAAEGAIPMLRNFLDILLFLRFDTKQGNLPRGFGQNK